MYRHRAAALPDACSGLMALAAGEQHETLGWKAEIKSTFSLFPPDIRKRRKISCSELVTEVGTLI